MYIPIGRRYIDARPGGIIRFGHRFPEGLTLHLKGTFGEMVLNERLVFTFGFVDERGQPVRHPIPRLATRRVDRDPPPDAASHPAAKRWSLAREGSMQVLDRLGEHLSLTTARKEHAT